MRTRLGLWCVPAAAAIAAGFAIDRYLSAAAEAKQDLQPAINLSAQEKEIDAVTAKQKALMADEFATRKSFEDYLANLSD